jgi:hypothetical protein
VPVNDCSGRLDHPDRLAGKERGDVLDGVAEEDLVGLLGDVADVRGEDGAPFAAERVVPRQRLGVEDVEPGAADRAFPQRLDQRPLVDERTAGWC